MSKHTAESADPVSDTEDPVGNPDWSPWVLLLIIPIVVPLVPALYNFRDPALFGIPAFYWIQLAFVFLSAGVTGIVYFKTKKR